MKSRRILVILTTSLICSTQMVSAVSAAEETVYEEEAQEDISILSDDGLTNEGGSYELLDGTFWRDWIKLDYGYDYTDSTSNADYSPVAGSAEEYITNSETAKKTTQIILVNGHNISLWNKEDGRWIEQFDAYCGYGTSGMIAADKHSELTRATPIGSYPIMFAFGKATNPGTSMTYRNVTDNSYWSDEYSTYNRWVESPTYVSGEHLADYYQYNYAMAIGFNLDPIVYWRGSAIFLHCKTKNKWGTAGCISVEESVMVELLKACRNGTYIIIVPDKESIANY